MDYETVEEAGSNRLIIKCILNNQGFLCVKQNDFRCHSLYCNGRVMHLIESVRENSPVAELAQAEMEVLRESLAREGREGLLSWLQEALLEACRVKMYPDSLIPPGSTFPLEPVPFYYNKAGQAIPLVPWNREQNLALQSETFILLLARVGLHLPTEPGRIYPRIPQAWSPAQIYTAAADIGHIQQVGFF